MNLMYAIEKQHIFYWTFLLFYNIIIEAENKVNTEMHDEEFKMKWEDFQIFSSKSDRKR